MRGTESTVDSVDSKGASKGKKKVAVTEKKTPAADEPTLKLLRDLSVATIASTRGSMADASLPTQAAIDEARQILGEAQKRLTKVGDDAKKQLKDKNLMEMTSLMYGRIPKKKQLRAKPEEWLLSCDTQARASSTAVNLSFVPSELWPRAKLRNMLGVLRDHRSLHRVARQAFATSVGQAHQSLSIASSGFPHGSVLRLSA